jgi:hypothetical protein
VDQEVARGFPPPLADVSCELRRGTPKLLWREGGSPAILDAIRRLKTSVTTTGISIATASTVTSGFQRRAARPHASVPPRCHNVSVDSTSLRDRPR